MAESGLILTDYKSWSSLEWVGEKGQHQCFWLYLFFFFWLSKKLSFLNMNKNFLKVFLIRWKTLASVWTSLGISYPTVWCSDAILKDQNLPRNQVSMSSVGLLKEEFLFNIHSLCTKSLLHTYYEQCILELFKI